MCARFLRNHWLYEERCRMADLSGWAATVVIDTGWPAEAALRHSAAAGATTSSAAQYGSRSHSGSSPRQPHPADPGNHQAEQMSCQKSAKSMPVAT
jgi:hypothetical protein